MDQREDLIVFHIRIDHGTAHVQINHGNIHGRTEVGDHNDIVLRIDRIHLNDKGKYLQGCVWYMILFGEKAEDIKCDFSKPEEKLLRECAAQAVAECKFNAR